MPSTMPILIVAFLVCFAHATGVATTSQLSSQVTLKAMERVFLRSEKAHSMSMETIMGSMSSTKAWQVLERSNLTSPALIQVLGLF